jgi:hypothetical protein
LLVIAILVHPVQAAVLEVEVPLAEAAAEAAEVVAETTSADLCYNWDITRRADKWWIE